MTKTAATGDSGKVLNHRVVSTRPLGNAPSLVMDSDHRQVRNGERREWWRSACPLRAHTTQSGYFFSVGYYISLSYESLCESGENGIRTGLRNEKLAFS